MVFNLDDIDRGILHLLQENAREATGDDMGIKSGFPPVQSETELNTSKRKG